ncbi:MAG: hypothetical protein DI599_18635 [Pseudomonas kuykendallii]|uniref:Uncharacterized protein n=1 Tax=Pseudomonas kuykendallii TaxID=1007099 RepID=A0A2W5CWP8_9PSED|nr:MAG: hypothetical protein DI599_18635 [Pseudomonas kuykendallii]
MAARAPFRTPDERVAAVRSPTALLQRRPRLGYCAGSSIRDKPVTSSTLLMRVIKAHARWRWRA